MAQGEPRLPEPAGAAASAPVSEQDRLARLLTENTTKAIFAFFIAGILLAFTPCVFPMVPILSGIIMGQGAAPDHRRGPSGFPWCTCWPWP